MSFLRSSWSCYCSGAFSLPARISYFRFNTSGNYMSHSFKTSIILATILVGAGGLSAAAAPAHAGDPTVTNLAVKPAVERTVEQRIDALHAKLQIKPTQQPQWDAFAQVMRENGREMDQAFHQRINTLGGMGAPENMASYAQVAMAHAQGVQKLVPVLQALYDTMSDSQKMIADKVFRDDAHHGKAVRHG